MAITAAATGVARARDRTAHGAVELAALGTLQVRPRRRGRAHPPLVAARASPIPRTRVAFLTKPPLPLLDDLAYGTGVWLGCIQHRTLDPLLPATAWKLVRRTL